MSHVEKESSASNTLKLRDSYYYLKNNGNKKLYYDFLNSNISENDFFKCIPEKILNKTINKEINNTTIDKIFEKIDFSLNNEKIFGIIGGPPCQAYSMIGRARNSTKKDKDVRIYLYRFYIDFLVKYQPSFFVFENVSGLLSFKDLNNELLFPKMRKEFRESGYEIGYKIINTVYYGVPQNRKRVIIFGTKVNKNYLINKFFNNLELLSDSNNIITVRKAFEGLPVLKSGETNNNYSNLSNDFVNEFYRADKNIPLTQNVSRPNNKNDLLIYKAVAQAKKNGSNLMYNDLNPKLITHKHINKFLDRYKSLSWDEPSHTIVAHIAKDGHHYIHPDINQNRSITVREAARLQGFSDDYYFENCRTDAFTQIGNAVPPILSQKIAKAVYLTFK